MKKWKIMKSLSSTKLFTHEASKIFVLWACMMAGIQLSCDGSLMADIAPSIGKELGLGQATVSLLSSIYIVTLAACVLAGGTLGDLYGHKRLIMIGVAVEGTMA